MTTRQPAKPKAKHFGTVIHFDLVNAPDCVTKDGLPFIADRLHLHIDPGYQWVWVEGRGVLKDGRISERVQDRRGTGFDLSGAPILAKPWREPPAWVHEVLASATFPKAVSR